MHYAHASVMARERIVLIRPPATRAFWFLWRQRSKKGKISMNFLAFPSKKIALFLHSSI